MAKLRFRNKVPNIRCEIIESYGCPSPAGDEFAAPVEHHCTLPATHDVKYTESYGPYYDQAERMQVCTFHALPHIVEHNFRSQFTSNVRVYRFRRIQGV